MLAARTVVKSSGAGSARPATKNALEVLTWRDSASPRPMRTAEYESKRVR
jgi:hypothetical protein